MTKRIHRALFEKVASLPEWQRFCADFEAICGIPLLLVDDLGRPVAPEGPAHGGPVCRALAQCEAGKRYCQLFRQRLLANVDTEPESSPCDAGAAETVVPLHVAGLLAGYLVFAGYRPGSADERLVRRARHLLDKAGVKLPQETIEEAIGNSLEIQEARSHALARVAGTAAHVITASLAPLATRHDRALPGMVDRACRMVRRTALIGPVRLADVAEELSVSTGHLSRAFHRHVGMTFSEYIARVRVSHAREMLRDPKRDISSIALDSGFGSISQFNRAFRAVYGDSPIRVRQRDRASSAQGR